MNGIWVMSQDRRGLLLLKKFYVGEDGEIYGDDYTIGVYDSKEVAYVVIGEIVNAITFSHSKPFFMPTNKEAKEMYDQFMEDK